MAVVTAENGTKVLSKTGQEKALLNDGRKEGMAGHETAAPSLNGQEEEQEPLDVLDLPQLYQKPLPDTLLSTLADLSLQPPSWDPEGPATTRRIINSEGIPAYLTKIIASPLKWIEDDKKKEEIWEMAAHRLSQRVGRSGMGAMTRDFTIPLDIGIGRGMATIRLHEPALTGDDLGLKTWAASYCLAKRLAEFKNTPISQVTFADENGNSDRAMIIPEREPEERFLELGAGTGLVGIAAAMVFQQVVICSDLPEILENLKRNVDDNQSVLEQHGGKAQAAVYDWGASPCNVQVHPDHVRRWPYPGNGGMPTSGDPVPIRSFRLILAADPIYSPEHPQLLLHALDKHLAYHRDSRFVMEIPIRDHFSVERTQLMKRLEVLGLEKIKEGMEDGWDDFGENDARGQPVRKTVRCWWIVWRWREDLLKNVECSGRVMGRVDNEKRVRATGPWEGVFPPERDGLGVKDVGR